MLVGVSGDGGRSQDRSGGAVVSTPLDDFDDRLERLRRTGDSIDEALARLRVLIDRPAGLRLVDDADTARADTAQSALAEVVPIVRRS